MYCDLLLRVQGEFNLRARNRNGTARVLGLANSAVRGASTCDSQVLGDTLQRRTSSERAGTWCAGSARGACSHAGARNPPSLGGGCARPREIGSRWPASRILAWKSAATRLSGRREAGAKRATPVFAEDSGHATLNRPPDTRESSVVFAPTPAVMCSRFARELHVDGAPTVGA